MRYFLLFTLAFLVADSVRVGIDTSEVKKDVEKIKIQQMEINSKLDSLWIILKIDSTLRRK